MAPKKNSTRPSGTIAQAPKTTKAPTKSPIGPGSGYLGYKPPVKKTPVKKTPVKDTTPTVRTETGRFTNADGSITITYSDGTTETIGGGNRTLPDQNAAIQEQNRRSAFALLEKEFTDNNLTTLVPEIKRFMTEGYGAEEASLLLPTKTVNYLQVLGATEYL